MYEFEYNKLHSFINQKIATLSKLTFERILKIF